MKQVFLQSSGNAAGLVSRGAAVATSRSQPSACNPGCHSRSICAVAPLMPCSTHSVHRGAAATVVTAAAAMAWAAAPTSIRSGSSQQSHWGCRCSSSSGEQPQPAPLVVVEGDTVTFHMTCRRKDGTVLESSREAGEPLSFEIGAGEIMGNPLYQAFDGSLRGLGVDDCIELEISGGEWKQELLFTVPRDHPEVERLEGRYKNQGGLAPDLAVELANGSMAVVVEATPEYVRLDANSMMSGKTLLFELEVLGIDRPPAGPA